MLVQNGSTHNFMQEEIAKLLKLTIHVIMPFKVSTGSGEKLVCSKVCKGVDIKFQGTSITMAGANMIIGIQGMKTLGPITFDFDSLQMMFEWGSKSVKWKGSP